MKILFICSRNQWRSPTAENIFRKLPHIEVRSAGLAKSARRRVTISDIGWADMIAVMEDHHKSRMRSEFRTALSGKDIIVLDIPDDYQYMDPELVDILRLKLTPLLP